MARHLSQKIFSLALIALLGACTMPAKDMTPCPAVGILPQAERAAFFDASGKQDEKNILAEARFGGYRGGCLLKNGNLQFALEVDFGVKRGQAGAAATELPLSYFVAVLDDKENILQRDAFQTVVPFNDKGTGLTREKHEIRIPLNPQLPKPEAVGAAVKGQRIVMGFVLTPRQLSYNTAVPAAFQPKPIVTPDPLKPVSVKKSKTSIKVPAKKK